MMIEFFLLLAVGFGVGYDVKTKNCNKSGCPAVVKQTQEVSGE